MNYDKPEEGDTDFTQIYKFMPDRPFGMLICSPSGGDKTNLLVDMLNRPLYYDKIYLYAKNLQQSKYQNY